MGVGAGTGVGVGVGGGGGGGLTVTFAFADAETAGPTGGCPVTVATFVNAVVTPVWVHVYDVLWPADSVPIVFAQPPESGSVTVTPVSVTPPVLVTAIVNVAVPPESTACVAGVFVIAIAGRSTTRCSDRHGLVAAPLFASPL